MPHIAVVWISQNRATILGFRDLNTHPTISHLESEVEDRSHVPEDRQTAVPYSARHSHNQTTLERRRHTELKHFFEDIAGKIRSADQILIIGPGEVKIEFKTFLERSKSNASKLIGLETCDKMFDEDLVKWVVPVIKTHQPLK
ncbi:MAG: hypothetical protein AAB066_00560 [Candidatus Margulisiibacteriota bacterium]